MKVLTTRTASYYVDAPPKQLGNVYLVDYIYDLRRSKRRLNVKREDLGENQLVDAPQVTVAQQVLDEWKRFDDADWEDVFRHVVDLIRESELLDPILKVQLLLQVLPVARTGSFVLDRAYARAFDELNESPPDGDVNWLDPTDEDAAKARKDARELLEGLPSLRAAGEAAMKEYAQLRKPWPAIRYRWVGWLLQDEDGRWRCASRPLSEGVAADLVLLAQADPSSAVELFKVGRVDKGHATISESGPLLLEGRAVYAAFLDDKTR